MVIYLETMAISETNGIFARWTGIILVVKRGLVFAPSFLQREGIKEKLSTAPLAFPEQQDPNMICSEARGRISIKIQHNTISK